MKKKETKKRKKKSSFEGLFDRILGSLFESIEDNTEDLLEKLGDFAFIKSTLKKQITYFMFSFVGILLFLMGMGLMINNFFPILKIWVIYLVLGIILYIIGLIYNRLK